MDLPIRMRITHNVKYRHVIRLEFGDAFITSLKKLMLKTKASSSSTIQEIILSYCRKFLAFAIAVIIQHLLITTSASKRNINFTIESLPFQNRLLEGANSIVDKKLSWLYIFIKKFITMVSMLLLILLVEIFG